MQTRFQDLDLNNAFLFAAALEDPEICRIILETLLGIPVGKVTVQIEHSMLFSSDFRSIRLDVYASNEPLGEFNLEMQNENEGNLAKRSRFHQAEMDVLSLRPGQDFEDLPPVYVIFLCSFDPFGLGLYRYTFKNICCEKSFPLDDGATRIFLNTQGTDPENVPDVLINFLRYVENSTDACAESLGDPTVRQIHEHVVSIKKSRKWERKFMRFEELLKKSEKKGREEAQEQLLALISRMSANNEADQIPRLSKDPSFLQAMLKKYNL